MDNTKENEWLIGEWRLLSMIVVGPNGSVIYPIGKTTTGQLEFTSIGTMSINYVPLKMPDFENIFNIAEDVYRVAKIFIGPICSGKYFVEGNQIMYLVQESATNNYIGSMLNWEFKHSDNKLTLSRVLPIEPNLKYLATAVWEKKNA